MNDKIDSMIRSVSQNVDKLDSGWQIIIWDKEKEAYGFCTKGFCEENKGKDSFCAHCPVNKK